jgi:hypothetical protein
LSARDRARINELIAQQELSLFFKEFGREIPKYLDYGVADRKRINGAYALAEAFLDELPGLMSYCTPGGDDEQKLLKAKNITERFIQGVNAMRLLPKQAPKHREALIALWASAQEEFWEIKRLVQNWGITPEQWQSPPPEF